jgi:hypothetical protein
MRGNIGQKLQNCSKLPQVHIEIYYDANKKNGEKSCYARQYLHFLISSVLL